MRKDIHIMVCISIGIKCIRSSGSMSIPFIFLIIKCRYPRFYSYAYWFPTSFIGPGRIDDEWHAQALAVMESGKWTSLARSVALPCSSVQACRHSVDTVTSLKTEARNGHAGAAMAPLSGSRRDPSTRGSDGEGVGTGNPVVGNRTVVENAVSTDELGGARSRAAPALGEAMLRPTPSARALLA